MIFLKDLLDEEVLNQVSSVDFVEEIIKQCDKLGNKTILNRSFDGNTFGIGKVKSEPYKKATAGGRLGMVLKQRDNENLRQKIFEVFDELNMKYVVYSSHGGAKFTFGQPHIMIPTGNFKVKWSPNIKDVYLELLEYDKKGELDKFPISSYKSSWPSGHTGEVLVDTKEYYLVNMKSHMIRTWQSYSKKNKVEPKTYKDVSYILKSSFKRYL